MILTPANYQSPQTFSRSPRAPRFTSIYSPSWSRRSGGGSSSVRLGVGGGGGGGGGGSRQRSNSGAAKFLGQGMTMGNTSGSSCRPPGG